MAPGESAKTNQLRIFTVGHSARPIEEFVGLLRGNCVARIIDIRTIPKSRHNPQFNTDALAASLEAAGVDYVHLKALGGLRKPLPDSRNMAWRNASFRGFADYMQTPEFDEGLARAVQLATEKPSALMCSEAVPWRGPLALPPLAGCRRAAGAGDRGARNHQQRRAEAARTDALCTR